MIDIKSKLVLKILQKECPNGDYKIIESKDIISSMPNRHKLDNSSLNNILIYLERQEFISIKYDDEGIYCLCILPFGYEYLQNQKEQKKAKENPLPLSIKILIVFFASFIANFLALLVYNIILR